MQSIKDDVTSLIQLICQYSVASWDKMDESKRIGLHYSPNNDTLCVQYDNRKHLIILQ